MNLLAGKAYISSCWYRLRARKPVEVQVRLESADGKTCYASASFTADSAEWQQAELTLTSTADDIGARLVVGCTEDVSLALDMVSLFPRTPLAGAAMACGQTWGSIRAQRCCVRVPLWLQARHHPGDSEEEFDRMKAHDWTDVPDN